MDSYTLLENTHFTGAYLMYACAVALVLMNPGKVQSHIYRRSRRFFVFGTLFIAFYHTLQYLLNWEQVHPGCAAALNFCMSSIFCSAYFCAELNMMRVGESRQKLYLVSVISSIVISLIGIVGWLTGTLNVGPHPVLSLVGLMGLVHILTLVVFIRTIVRISKQIADVLPDDDERLSHHNFGQWMARTMRAFSMCATYNPAVVLLFGWSYSIQVVFNLIWLTITVWHLLQFYRYGVDMELVIDLEDEISRLDFGSDTGASPVRASQDSMVAASVREWVEAKGYTDAAVTLSQAAEQMGINKRQLSQYLHNAYNQEFADWRRMLRIEEAKRLLRKHPDYSHEAVAEISGFSSRVTFYRSFKQETGVTPGQWSDKIKN